MVNSEKLKQLKKDDIVSLFKFFLALIPACVLRLFRQDIWLCVERISIADDNAWMLYKWLRKNHPEENAYFLLDRKAPNFDIADRHMIAWGSLRHYIYYLASSKCIMATFNTTMPNVRICSNLRFLRLKAAKVYLRHGISKDGMEEHRYEIHHFRIFICGAKPEYDYVKIAGGYPEDNVKYTGFARFDDLLENRRDDHFILVIPTWRKYIGVDHSKTQEENEAAFKSSAFYENYIGLIHNPEFISFLTRNNLKARFCLHAEYRRFEKFFTSDSDRVEIVRSDESIHELLMTTSLLITDYSSVFFDAAYAEKPVIYFHFDYEEFRQKHLKEGYFSYERDGMGPIAHDIPELLADIRDSYADGRFSLEKQYLERADRFFPMHDTGNCERIYSEIKKI